MIAHRKMRTLDTLTLAEAGAGRSLEYLQAVKVRATTYLPPVPDVQPGPLNQACRVQLTVGVL